MAGRRIGGTVPWPVGALLAPCHGPVVTAAEFQRQIINSYLKEIRSRYEGRVIVHTHDWMAGGALTAYAHLREMPILHTVHNTHTAHIPFETLHGINLEKLHKRKETGNLHGSGDER